MPIITKGVPVVSLLIQDDENHSKIFKIGDTMTDVVESSDETPFTGILRGIQLEARENDLNQGHVVYDNIPTIGYWNPGCGMADVSAEDYQVDSILLQDVATNEYRIVKAENLKSVLIYDEETDTWISATEEAVIDYINSINNNAINSIVVNDMNIDVVINTTDGLDIGLIDFLTSIDGLQSVEYKVGNQSYTLTVGDTSTYDQFKKGVLASMPNTTGASTNGSVNMNAENGTTLVYTLKVKYFNEAEEFLKLDNYLTGYAGEDASVVKNGDRDYTITTHVDAAADLAIDIFPAIAQISDLTNVKVTVGDAVINNTDVTALKNFLMEQLHFEQSWDAVNVSVEIAAGGLTQTYTISYVSDYSVVDAVTGIMGPVFAPVDNDQFTLAEDGADGITWNTLTLKVDPQDLTDLTGFVAALKALPHTEQVTVNVGDSGYQIIAAPFDDEKIAQIRSIIVDNAPKSVNDTQNVIFGIQPGFGDFVNPQKSEIVSFGGFMNSVFDPEAKVGEHGYATVEAALAAAEAGDTVSLLKDITVSNDAVNGTPNSPVLAIPAITFDGMDHTITADEGTWVGTNANHVLGASNVAATIKNVNVVGHANTKSGIVCFGQSGNVTLENVDVQNCGNCGVQVAGATVSATNLTTSGNAWGGVNADMGSDGSTPALTIGDGCTFGEMAEVYTEITDQEVVTAPSLTKYQGFGTNLKSFIYYTSDVSRLGTLYNGAVYETVNDILANNDTVDLTVEEDLNENVEVPAGKTLNLNLNGKTITNSGASDTLVNNGTLVLTGTGVIDNVEVNKAALTNNGNLTILGGTISRSQDTGVMDDSTHPGYYTLVNHGTMVIGAEDADNSGITISSTGGYSALVENGWYDSEGKVAGEDDCHLTIYGGNFVGGKYGVKNDELGHANIYGGNFSGSSSVNVLNWHNLYIHDGTFDGSAKKTANIMNGKYNLGVGHAEISGGDFTTGGAACIIQVNGYGSNDVSLTGGVYNKKIGLASYLADGYELDEEINPGKFTVVQVKAAEINGVSYPNVAAAIAAVTDNTPTTIEILRDVTENVEIPVGRNITLTGGDSSATINGGVTIQAAGTEDTNVTIEHINLTSPGASKTYGIISQNQSDEGQMNCNLTLNDVIITGFASKAIYGTNIKALSMTGCTFENCATGTMDDPNTKGDYAVDLNLVAVQDAVITIDGCTFKGDLGDNAAIKIAARGGASDADATDIPKNVGEATVEKVTISGCDFSQCTTEVDFRIGTSSKTAGAVVNTTGAYAVDINTGASEINVLSAYKDPAETLVVPAGRSAVKAADGDIALVLTPAEEVDQIMSDIPGAEETSDNVFEFTTDSQIDLSFLDEIAAVDGFTSMQVTDGQTTYTFTGDGLIDEFKTQVQSMLPASNEDPQVTLTLTINLAE